MRSLLLSALTVILALSVLSPPAPAQTAVIEAVPNLLMRDIIFIRPTPTVTVPPPVINVPAPIVNVAPAPVTVVVNESAIKTIDVDLWLGYHAGNKVRLAVKYVVYVRPHTATAGTNPVVTLQGSAIAVWPEGIFYTRELPEALTQRLSDLGWGEGPSTLLTPVQP